MARAEQTQRSERKWVRVRFFVNAHFQSQMVMPIALYTLAFGAFALGLVFLPLHHRLDSEPSPDVQALLGEQLFEIELRLLPALGFAAFGAAGYALLLSHRAAGPLFRFARALERMSQGNFEPVRFRKGDFFRELEILANELRGKLQAFAARDRDTLIATEKNLRQLSQRLETTDVIPKGELEKSLNAIADQIRKSFERPRVSG